MNSRTQRKKDTEFISALRKKAGLWLREKREAAGLSQRELAEKVGIEYYTFISQIESGRGKVPTDRYQNYANALDIPDREFATTMLRYNDPYIYDMIFGEENPTISNEYNIEALETRLRMLEAKLLD